jgi:hypothetical protein
MDDDGAYDIECDGVCVPPVAASLVAVTDADGVIELVVRGRSEGAAVGAGVGPRRGVADPVKGGGNRGGPDIVPRPDDDDNDVLCCNTGDPDGTATVEAPGMVPTVAADDGVVDNNTNDGVGANAC